MNQVFKWVHFPSYFFCPIDCRFPGSVSAVYCLLVHASYHVKNGHILPISPSYFTIGKNGIDTEKAFWYIGG